MNCMLRDLRYVVNKYRHYLYSIFIEAAAAVGIVAAVAEVVAVDALMLNEYFYMFL